MKPAVILLLFAGLLSCDEEGDNRDLSSRESVMEVADEELVAFDVAIPPTEQGKWVQSSRLEIELKQTDRVKDSVLLWKKKYQLRMESESANLVDGGTLFRMQLLIPERYLTTILDNLEKMSTQVHEKFINRTNVEQMYVDDATRLKNKLALEDRYREILQKATTVRDMLDIEEQLHTVRSQIELLQQQQAATERDEAYSSLNLAFYSTNITEQSYFSKVLTSLQKGWRLFVSFSINVFSIWPFVVLASIMLTWLARRRAQFRRSHRPSVSNQN